MRRSTAKTKNAEASCKVTVTKTKVTLNKTSLTLENGESAVLTAASSTGHKVTWKSAKTSIASVSENGKVTAKKPGTTTVTAKVDGTSVNCKVTVKSPTVRLMPSKISLYRREKYKLKVSSTSKTTPVWKTNKKSVATVDETGKVTAVKHGTAVITVTVDGVSKNCEVTVRSPKITLSRRQLHFIRGTCKSKCDGIFRPISGVFLLYSNVVSVDANGVITAKAAGRSYVYASEDGTKERMTVYVKEKE